MTPKKTKPKVHTREERISAIFRCKCGESHASVAKDLGITQTTMTQWVARYKSVKPSVMLEMLNHRIADLLAKGPIDAREISPTVTAVKMILDKGTSSDTQETLDKLIEMGAKILTVLKAGDENTT